jgi:protein-tyrosine phosphatase
MNTGKRVKVLFVCMGNICRSPTAEGVFAKRLQEEGLHDVVEIDSAGTHAYHVGEAPDPRAQRAAEKRGVQLKHLRARRAVPQDFEQYDYVLAMDRDNLVGLEAIYPPGAKGKPHLFLSYAPNLEHDEVPDPYYGGPMGFERVLDMIEEASEGLLQDIRLRHLQ